jgi:hypothetical protein
VSHCVEWTFSAQLLFLELPISGSFTSLTIWLCLAFPSCGKSYIALKLLQASFLFGSRGQAASHQDLQVQQGNFLQLRSIAGKPATKDPRK